MEVYSDDDRSPRELRSAAPLPLPSLIGHVTAALAVVVITLLYFQQLQERGVSGASVIQTMSTIDQLGNILSTLKDAETGQRGYLLTGSEDYLAPYTSAQGALNEEFSRAGELIPRGSAQGPHLQTLKDIARRKMDELGETVALRQAGSLEQALSLVRTNRGKETMDEARTLVSQMQATERRALDDRERAWVLTSRNSFVLILAGGLFLLVFIATAAVLSSRAYRAQLLRTWQLHAQNRLAGHSRGDQPLHSLCENSLAFLTKYLDAQIGVMYAADHEQRLCRVATYALAADAAPALLAPGDGLAGQVLRDRKPVHVRDVPAGHFAIASATGRSSPCELLIAPALVDGSLQAVVEFGFFHPVSNAEKELLARVSEQLAVAVRASKDRTRLESLLEETQLQTEELQTQQEELRVANEELTEQGRLLKESHTQLSSQQAELEQINDHMHRQATLLEQQTKSLTESEGALRERAEDLERANRFKSEFLANMSHELRTPLNSVLILAKLLSDNKSENLTPQQVRFAQTITSSGNDLLALINDVLDLARIEAGKMEIDTVNVDIAPLLDSLNAMFQPQFAQKNLELSFAIDPAAPALIRSDPQRISQILKNLLSNALKFTEQGSVSVRVSGVHKETLAFEVRDTGIGIPAQQQELIFEPFRQGDGSVVRRFGGTGLGLSISRDFARLLGGDILLQSIEGQGSVFTLTLPREPRELHEAFSRPSAAAAVVPTNADAIPRRQRTKESGRPSHSAVEDDREQLKGDARTILVIEDDTSFAMIMRDLVRELGYQCLVSHDATDGIYAASRFRPNAILLDVNLPDRSGLSVLNDLKRNPDTRHIPVHMVSVADHSRAALELGAVGYALKPVQREQLVSALRKLEDKFSQRMHRVLIAEDNEVQRRSIAELLSNEGVQVTSVATASDALDALKAETFDCMVLDLHLPDLDGYRLLEEMARNDAVAFPPVIVYTGSELSTHEEQELRRFSKSIIIKDAHSPERLLDEVTLFLHQVEVELPPERQKMLRLLRNRERSLDGKSVLVVDDDVRNIFALTNVLEPKGAKVQIARNGREAIAVLEKSELEGQMANLVLMDIMMPEMDGFEAMRAIRLRPAWRKLPIIALTAKAMKDDQQRCLEAGANDYIMKPLDVEKLLSLIRVWMPQ